jgi:hypothetical protein
MRNGRLVLLCECWCTPSSSSSDVIQGTDDSKSFDAVAASIAPAMAIASTGPSRKPATGLRTSKKAECKVAIIFNQKKDESFCTVASTRHNLSEHSEHGLYPPDLIRELTPDMQTAITNLATMCSRGQIRSYLRQVFFFVINVYHE